MWVAPDGLASAPHPPANRGGAVGGAAAASPEPPGLRRPKASHPPAGRPEPRAAPPALPFAGAWGERPALRDGLTSSGTPAADGCWPGKAGVDQIIDRVVLEQFIARLPTKTAQWVQCHRPCVAATWPSNSPRTRWWRATGLANPTVVSLSLPSLLFLPLPSCPGPRAAWFPEPSPDGGEARLRSRRPARAHAREAVVGRCYSVPPVSPRNPCPPSRH